MKAAKPSAKKPAAKKATAKPRKAAAKPKAKKATAGHHPAAVAKTALGLGALGAAAYGGYRLLRHMHQPKAPPSMFSRAKGALGAVNALTGGALAAAGSHVAKMGVQRGVGAFNQVRNKNSGGTFRPAGSFG